MRSSQSFMGDLKKTPTGIAWKPPLLTPAPFTHPVVSVLFIPLIFDVTLGTREEYLMVALFFDSQTLSECFGGMDGKKKSDDI